MRAPGARTQFDPVTLPGVYSLRKSELFRNEVD